MCSCAACSGRRGTALFADVAESDAEAPADVPAEVEALDGIESQDEAHNTERPARSQLKKKRPTKGKELSEFTEGTMVTGRVKSIASYGAFIDIGAQTDGLLHISQLTSGYVSNVSDVLAEGQEIQVRIMNIDIGKNQVALSLMTEEEEAAGQQAAKEQREQRQQREQRSERSDSRQSNRRDDDPTLRSLSEKGWDTDAFVEGTVVSTVDFGCFVRINASLLNSECEGEFDGLVHISALGTNRVGSVKDVVNVDDKVQVRCKSIQGNKVSLTMLSSQEESAKNEASGGGGGGRDSAPAEGAKDWMEQLEKVQSQMPTFVNKAVVQDRRK